MGEFTPVIHGNPPKSVLPHLFPETVALVIFGKCLAPWFKFPVFKIISTLHLIEPPVPLLGVKVSLPFKCDVMFEG